MKAAFRVRTLSFALPATGLLQLLTSLKRDRPIVLVLELELELELDPSSGFSSNLHALHPVGCSDS